MTTSQTSTSTTGKLLKNLTAGTLSALVSLSYSISYAALIFSGPELQPYITVGLQTALMASWITALVVALGSSFRFSIAGADSNATAVLSLMAAALAGTLVAEKATGAQVGATLIAMLVLSAIAIGFFIFMVGALRRGRLVRFLPYPVIGGFLAGTGFVIIAGGFKLLTGNALNLEALYVLRQAPALGWITAFCVSAGLLILPRYFKHFLVIPCVILVGLLVFFIGFKLSNLTMLEARHLGLMLQPIDDARGPTGLTAIITQTESIQWLAIFSQWQHFLALGVVVIVTILLNATGLELATQSDVDFDHELRVNGLANILSGLCGGMIGYLSISRSVLNFKAGACSKAAGIWTSILCLGASLFFLPAVVYFPRPVLAGILLYLGFSMLKEWVWDTCGKLPRKEYGLIIGILLLIASQGLIPGIIFGLVVASVFFVYNYAKTSCIKHSFSNSTRFSNKERSREQTQTLKETGGAARTLLLQGYIFFGTSSGIVEACRDFIELQGLRFLLLDFRLVQGLDASAVLSFTKLEQLCLRHRVKLSLSGLRPGIEAVLKKTRFLSGKAILIFPDMDRGLEWMEDQLLDEVPGTHMKPPEQGQSDTAIFGSAMRSEIDLRHILSDHFTPAAMDTLIRYCETLKLQEGMALFRAKDPGDALYFIERGEVSVLLPLNDGQTRRLRTFGPGTVVGEMALYSRQPRSADVVTVMPCRVRKLSSENLERMGNEHPDVAIMFHIFVIKLLSVRLSAANEEIRALL